MIPSCTRLVPCLSLCLHRLTIQPSSPCLFRIPPHLASNLNTNDTWIAQSRQHNIVCCLKDSELGPSTNCVPPRQLNPCSAPQPCRIGSFSIGFPHSFIRLLLVFLLRASTCFLPYLSTLLFDLAPAILPLDIKCCRVGLSPARPSHSTFFFPSVISHPCQ